MTQGGSFDPRHPGRRSRIGRRLGATIVLILVLALGAGAGVIWSERRAAIRGASPGAAIGSGASPPASMPAMPGAPAGAPRASGTDEAVEITLTPDAIARAGIKTAVAQSGTTSAAVTAPGTVASNAYRDTKVNALVGGIARQVAVELGAAVKRGDVVAVIFSSELADAQVKYLSMRAMLGADHQKLERTEKLVGIGAASRQELEEVTAVHTGHETEVAAARQRLLLLGLSSDQVDRLTGASQVLSEVVVRAPADGVVVARSVNQGQVVSSGQELFTITDLRTVWVIGELYEKDFAAVRVGLEATITAPAASGAPLHGRVSYIDPRVESATRTVKARIEVPNPTGALKLGMFVNVAFQTASGQRVTLVPRTAVQSVGERNVVYVAGDDPGRFTERTVKLGAAVGDAVQVVDGMKPGERVVTEGSFFLRAEATRTRSGG